MKSNDNPKISDRGEASGILSALTKRVYQRRWWEVEALILVKCGHAVLISNMLCRFLGCLLLFCFVFCKKSAYDDEHCNLTVLFSRLIWELATDDARRKWRDDLEQMKLNEPGKSKLKRMKLLAMYQTYMGIF